MSVLKADHIGINFGGLCAVDDFNLELNGGEICAIIGPNGAGKTTIFNMLTGIYQPTVGKIYVNGHDMSNSKPFEFTSAGLARTFQNIRLFNQATVLDNVKIAHTFRAKYGFVNMLLRNGNYRNEEKRITADSTALLEMFGLLELKDQFANALPYGEQRKLEIVRALATGPSVLLLDEPAAGMNPNEIENIMELVRRVNKEFGKTILLIEHHMNLVMAIAEYIKVIDFGVTICEGVPEVVKSDRKVIKAYLGGGVSNDA